MQVSNPNNIKIYNLSSGKSIPEWIDEKKRRKLLKKDAELRRRIQLLQDFDMPTHSRDVGMTKDGQYIYAAGAYKPRVKFFDVAQMSLKFERCVDNEVVKLQMLSEDYSKFVLLETDRYVEIHTQQGRYYRLRIPKFGRDMSYHEQTCDLYITAAGSEVYRVNLELGHFMKSIETDASEVLCCEINPHHQLFTCGTKEGTVECWDPRDKTRAGVLNCCTSEVLDSMGPDANPPAVTTLAYKDALKLGVGMSTGQVLLYDIRAKAPYITKDHNYELPINGITFCQQQDLVISTDSRILKIWHHESGKQFTAIEPEAGINGHFVVPKSGLLFMPNEGTKILSYYIPSLGPAPKWCAFLDSLTEELEETDETNPIYDDFKFITHSELQSLGLNHLIGTNLLRAYMHGYFLNSKLYKDAKAKLSGLGYEDFRKNKIKEKIEVERSSRVQVKKLPKINSTLAKSLMKRAETKTGKWQNRQRAEDLLQDDRFSSLFSNKDFAIDTMSEEYRIVEPLINRWAAAEKKRKESEEEEEEEEEADEQEVDEQEEEEEEDSSSDEDMEDLKQQYRKLKQEKKRQQWLDLEQDQAPRQLKMLNTEGKEERKKEKLMKKSLEDRLSKPTWISKTNLTHGAMEVTYVNDEKPSEALKRKKELSHRRERKQLRRSAAGLKKRTKKH